VSNDQVNAKREDLTNQPTNQPTDHHHSPPVAEEVLHRSVVHGEVGLQLTDRFLGGSATQAVVMVDLCCWDADPRVRGAGEEPPAAEVVEAQLLAGRLSLTAHDEAQVTT
jgi:hypothetical protein